jgi:hypothetical protein
VNSRQPDDTPYDVQGTKQQRIPHNPGNMHARFSTIRSASEPRVNALSRISAFARSRYLIIGAPFVLYCAHALLFGDWIIDDAGISFAYARSLAYGHGLVSQPGMSPLEGYSNFTWVLVLAPLFRLHLFDPMLTPKITAALFVLLSFATVYRISRSVSSYPALVASACAILMALNTSFVAWTISGLENSLLVLLALLTLDRMIAFDKDRRPRTAVGLGICAALLAMTRPDAIVYSVVPTILLAISRKQERPAATQGLLVYLAVLAALYGIFLCSRVLYFHDIVPNSYHVKGGPTPQGLVQALLLQPSAYARIAELFHVVASYAGNVVLFALLPVTGYLSSRRVFRRRHAALLMMLGCSAFIYVVLPADWMGESRFATPFIPFFFLYVFLLGEMLLVALHRRPSVIRVSIGVAALVAIAFSATVAAKRTSRFTAQPVVPFGNIAENYGHVFNRYAERLHVRQGSILLPDVGGALYCSELRVYDLGGLTDRTITRTLGKRQQQFYDYVFEIARPTFIHTHKYWAYVADLDADPRFRREYVAIWEGLDPWIARTFHRTMYEGDYIRKDALGGDMEALRRMQESHRLRRVTVSTR